VLYDYLHSAEILSKSSQVFSIPGYRSDRKNDGDSTDRGFDGGMGGAGPEDPRGPESFVHGHEGQDWRLRQDHQQLAGEVAHHWLDSLQEQDHCPW